MQKHIWKLLPKASSIQIKVKFMGVGSVITSFLKFKGEVFTEHHFKNPQIQIRIDARMVSTLDEQLDERLKSAEFLHTDKYPAILFSALEGCRESSGGITEVSGQLSIRGKIVPITLVVNFSDFRQDTEPPSANFNLFGHISLRKLDIATDRQNDVEDDMLLNATISLQLTARKGP